MTTPGPGHNASAEQLRSLVARIERLNAEKAELTSDIAEIFKESKSAGYEPSIIRQLIRIRAQDAAKAAEEAALLDTYQAALGDA